MKILQEKFSVVTRDGIRLDADRYYPETNEKLPILLMRQPYGRAIASTVVYAHPRWYAAQGYQVVIQDVRGCGTSEGDFHLFQAEVTDGFDTLQALQALPNSTGDVGMYGFSYQGMTQLYAAASGASNLKTICPAMIAYDLYQDWAYENHAFCWQNNLAWAIQLAALKAKHQGKIEEYQALYQASRQLPLHEPFPINPQILRDLAPDSFYHDWLYRPPTDPYWQILSPRYWREQLDLPMLHIGGWFDPHLRGNLRLYEALRRRSQFPQFLIIGPWGHLPWGRRIGHQDFGTEAVSEIDRFQITWFDHFLKGKTSALLTKSRVKLFEMGSNHWQNFEDFSLQKKQVYYLVSEGLAAVNEQSGKLVPIPLSSPEFLPDHWVHDPWRPVPSLGGHAGFSVGMEERSLLDSRTDVVTYTSETLTESLTLMGSAQVELKITADQPSFDLSVILSVVKSTGQVYGICQGYGRFTNFQETIHLVLQATYYHIPQGDRLRLSISGSCFPAYAVNSGLDQVLAQTHLSEYQVITYTLIGGTVESKLVLPIIKN